MAAGIVGLGIEPGSAICLFSHTRYEFTILDYAILAAGCVTVPIYETDSADQVKWVATNSGAVAIVVENTTLERNVDAVAADLPAVRHTLLIDGGGLDALRAAAKDVDPSEVEKRWKAITHDQLASIVYTSGTTGLPKGCVLTHGNFASEVGGVAVLMEALLNEQATTLMFLPLAHVLARVVQFACVTQGVQLGYSGIATLTEELKLFPPTFLFAVPRVFEKVFNGARAQAGGGLKTKIFDRAADVSIAFSTQEQAGKVSAFTKVAAPAVRQARLQQAPRRHGRQGPLRHLRRRPARRAPRELLQRPRAAGARGLRPHRDHRGRDGQHARPPQDRHGRPPGARHDHPHRRRRRGAGAGRDRVRRLLRQRRGHRPRRCRTTGSTPATSASSTPTASSRSPAARRTSSSPPAARTCSRPSWRIASRPTRWSAWPWWWATTSRSSPPSSPSTPTSCGRGPRSTARTCPSRRPPW